MTFHDTSLEWAAQAMTPAGGPGYSPGAMTDISSATIAELGQALRAGRVTARGLLEQALANRSEALGAYKLWMPDQAARAADLADAAFAEGLDFGPLQGLPVSVKDLFGLAGAPTHAGAPKPLPASWEAEGPVVAAVRNGLAVVTGKTHTVEFAFGGVGSNPHWGTPRNPWGGESHRVPGGSSAGAGVSLLEGTAVVALGSDTAGSVRVPASFTGTVGLKTSYGRWSLRGIVPLSPSLDTAGVLTRSVADAALAFAAIDPVCRTPPEPADPARLRLGVIESLFEDCGPGVAEIVRAALAELEERGVTVEAFDLPEMADARAVFAEGGLAVPEFVAFIENELPDFKATLDPNVRSRFEAFGALTSTEYLGRRMRIARAAAAANARLAGIDAIVGPTTPITAPLLQHAAEGEGYRTHNMAALRNTMPGNLLELCGLTIPAGLDGSGMPVGLQLLAPRGRDERLISIGLAVEGIIGPASRRLGTPPGL